MSIDNEINKNIDKCFSCKKSFDYQFDQFYKNKFNDIYNIFADTIIGNTDIIKLILSYIGYYKHTVKHQCKQKFYFHLILMKMKILMMNFIGMRKKYYVHFAFKQVLSHA